MLVCLFFLLVRSGDFPPFVFLLLLFLLVIFILFFCVWFVLRSLRRMEWGGCWCCLRRSFTLGATLRCTTLPLLPPTPTCRPSSLTRIPSCLILLLTCTQAWLGELETWMPSTSPSTTQPTSTQTRVSVCVYTHTNPIQFVLLIHSIVSHVIQLIVTVVYTFLYDLETQI